MAIVTKTYITKSNTLIKDSNSNTGLNPILELNYGKMNTRGILYFNHEKVKKMVEDKIYPDMSKLRHVLKMTNSSSITDKDFNKKCLDSEFENYRQRATSFDLVFFIIDKEWDCGRGFDYVMDVYNNSHRGFSVEGSNWYNCKTNARWNEEGVFTIQHLSKEVDKFTSLKKNSDIIIAIQHFDYGNENIEVDITDTFNKFISGDLKNRGIGIAFMPSLEQIKSKYSQYVGFFTRHTHSFFEPYVETTYKENIEDDRINFSLDKDNKLYLYVNIGGNYENLDELPTCSIDGHEYEVKQSTKGIYYIDVKLSSVNYESGTMMYDIWSNLFYKKQKLEDVELSFVLKNKENHFSVGLPQLNDETKIIPSLYGINDHEQIIRGDIRKVNVDCRVQYTSNQQQPVADIKYRVYVIEGNKQYDVISWNKVERGYNENYFLINTLEMIPSRYYVDICIESGYNVINHHKTLQFDIVEDITETFV